MSSTGSEQKQARHWNMHNHTCLAKFGTQQFIDANTALFNTYLLCPQKVHGRQKHAWKMWQHAQNLNAVGSM